MMPDNTETTTTVEIEWSYTPPTYFEEPITLERDGYTIQIREGKIKATMPGSRLDSQEGLREVITNELDNYFLGAQPFRNARFKISGGAINRYYPDGRKNTTIVIQSGTFKMTGGRVDLVYTDSNGIVQDTRKERIKKTQRLAELASQYAPRNVTAKAVLKSYDAAINDSANELVHLFEVWETLAKTFGSEADARNSLGISNAKRSRLGQLANDEPLRQGRHRGKHPGGLRNATTDELDEARSIARKMIGAFLEYLEKQHS